MSKVINNKNKLTIKQEKFVEAMADPNVKSQTQAALKAGYSPRTARFTAAKNATKGNISEAVEKQRTEITRLAQIDHAAELRRQFEFATALREAAEEYLTADDGKLNLSLRDEELEIVYLDCNDTDENGKPKRKTDSLAHILARLEERRLLPVKVSTKSVDIREFALRAIEKVDLVLDKFARVGGLYKQDAPPVADVETIARQTLQFLQMIRRFRIDHEKAEKQFIETQAQRNGFSFEQLLSKISELEECEKQQ